MCDGHCLQGFQLPKHSTTLVAKAGSLGKLKSTLKENALALDVVAVAAAMKRLQDRKVPRTDQLKMLRHMTSIAIKRCSITDRNQLNAAAHLLHHCARLRCFDAELISTCFTAIVQQRSLGDVQSLSTAMFAVARMADVTRGRVPGLPLETLRESFRLLLEVCHKDMTSSGWDKSVRGVEQLMTATAMVRVKPNDKQSNDFIEALLEAFPDGGTMKHSSGMLANIAKLGIVPEPQQLRQLFELAVAATDYDSHSMSKTVSNVFLALRLYATEIPGGLQALAANSKAYSIGCGLLLETFVTLPSDKAQNKSHLAFSLGDAAVLATSDPPIISRTMVEGYLRQLWAVTHKAPSPKRATPFISTMAAVCEAIVLLDMEELAPAVAESLDKVAVGFRLEKKEAEVSNLVRESGPMLWRAHCWLEQKQQGGKVRRLEQFTQQQLQQFEAAAADAAAAHPAPGSGGQ